jgi:hypothetical protein
MQYQNKEPWHGEAVSAAAAVSAAVEEGSSAAVAVASAVEEGYSDFLSLNISYKQLIRSILVTATAVITTHNGPEEIIETRTKKTNRQYVSTQQLILLDTVSAASDQTSARMG